ncbi:carbohydrate ABC transporter, N-acetylglucosamine/diacetylchitobiose-binding protein [Pseudactinotalea sp. HY160]|uniref:N-acetylglucosamine/diacetylchitobiose ABC transporter substrate-binding protein n=1 Tax=Pseudactinotalea sp. HY160 TaxID=2654490 RepID=UPI00128DA696|nr:N-acetylglucosamine/diacetylchitobiose ABC transporter substrate-binding protein [Pseudactinotalea sp. HY160]MPV49956.1 carbohydrate ABC transporter, N-acetylglucosamine/diacetylchitobiose-binding protein [Pseudactinotalea sp. HY160]
MNDKSLSRRSILRGAAATAVALPFGVALASCASSGGGSEEPTDDATTDGGDSENDPTKNPFGVEEGSSIEAVIFDGGYGTDYVSFAGGIVDKNLGTTTEVKPTQKVAQELQPRFVSGDVPDLIDNSGADQIGWNDIRSRLETLDDVLEANNLEGSPIKDSLFPGVRNPGTFDGKFVALNYVLTVYGVWYSSSLFEENGWDAPVTWDDALDLGAKAKEQGKYLFTWGKEAATYYQTLAIDSAVKEGGDDVRLALENLEEGCWSKPEIQGVFEKIKEAVDKGYFIPGGAGTQFTAAQAQWSQDQEAILYPSGSWIENEMKDATAPDFKMKGVPDLSLSKDAKLTTDGLRAEAGEPFCVPSQADNVAGGKEVLRTMLSKEAATNFAKEKLAPTVVLGTVPEDGFGSTALVSQSDMLDAAGENTFTIKFINLYGMNPDQLVYWNSFLSGDKSVEELTSDLQGLTDKIREDDAIDKVKIS